MYTVVYHGNAASRSLIQQYEFKEISRKGDGKRIGMHLDVLITTFEMVVADCEFLRRFNWRIAVIDEAHRLKNRNCKLLTSGLQSLKMEHRVLLVSNA